MTIPLVITCNSQNETCNQVINILFVTNYFKFQRTLKNEI